MCSGIPIKLLNFSDLTKFLVLIFHAKHQIFNGLNTWLLGAVNKFSKNNRSIVMIKQLLSAAALAAMALSVNAAEVTL